MDSTTAAAVPAAPPDPAQRAGGARVAVVIGLPLALFGIPALVAAFRRFTGENHSDLQVASRELTLFALVALLLAFVTRVERLPLASIGLRFDAFARSLRRGLVLGVGLLVLTFGLYLLLSKLGVSLGGGHGFVPSVPVVLLQMLRAGFAEEVCYRGYALERMQKVTGSVWVAGAVSLALFAAAHYRQGLGGVIAALVLGGVMTAYYVKRRDLVANIVGHVFVDVVLNVGLPLLGG